MTTEKEKQKLMDEAYEAYAKANAPALETFRKRAKQIEAME